MSQPTLSVAIRKLEDKLGVTLFERGGAEVSVTPIGERIVAQAHKVLLESEVIREIARSGHDPLAGFLNVGVIYTIGPYLLPKLIPVHMKRTPQMPLILQEDFTHNLVDQLRKGELDCAIMALPLPEAGLDMVPLYDESFVVALPTAHPWSSRERIDADELKQENMLLLGHGHCFRDQVLSVCPELSRYSDSTEGMQRTFEGSSLETIRHMVAAGIGVTVMPETAITAADNSESALIHYIPFEAPAPDRRVVLAWRRSFTRMAAIEALVESIRETQLEGVTMIDADLPVSEA